LFVASCFILFDFSAPPFARYPTLDFGSGAPFFVSHTDQIEDNVFKQYYGISVVDVDGDGQFEAFLSGYATENKVHMSRRHCLERYIYVTSPLPEA
jgi:hypothetical protein